MTRVNRYFFVLLGWEAALIVSLYFAYSIARGLVYDGQLFSAFGNAREIINAEKALRIFVEPIIQEWLVKHATAIVLSMNWFYIIGYWPVIAVLSVALYMRDKDSYKKYRTITLITFGIAVLVYKLYPLAPPRMMLNDGFLDTIKVFGPVEYHSSSEALLYNPYAAMPSMHFALAFIITLMLFSRKRMTLKLAGVAYSAFMLMAIVITGNHYFMDAVGSVLVVGASFGIYSFAMALRRKSGSMQPAAGGA